MRVLAGTRSTMGTKDCAFAVRDRPVHSSTASVGVRNCMCLDWGGTWWGWSCSGTRYEGDAELDKRGGRNVGEPGMVPGAHRKTQCPERIHFLPQRAQRT